MADSLRFRLILWHAGVLALVVASFGAAVSCQAWRSAIASLDRELLAHAHLVAAAVRPAGEGRLDVDLPPEAVAYFRQDVQRPYYGIWTSDGTLVDSSDAGNSASDPPHPGARTMDGRREVTVSQPGGAAILVGRDLSAQTAAAWSLGVNIALAGLAAVVAAIGGGWFVAGRALAPIDRISRAAGAMAAGDLAARIPVDRTESELEDVAGALNVAFDRLRLALDQQRRFTADASHELRTPLSVARAELEWALGRDRSPGEYRQSLLVCLRAADRIEQTVEALLRTSRADASEAIHRGDRVGIESLAADIAGSLGPLAHARGVALEVKGGDFPVAADRGLLREALSNVVANAIQYNRRGGRVVIEIQRGEEIGLVNVADTGIGIPEWAVPRVFDRFFRVDEARGRDRGGAGLGLSVARAIVAAHRGTISCASREGSGTVFSISLPVQGDGRPAALKP
jgi:signal transduction histidine kinase